MDLRHSTVFVVDDDPSLRRSLGRLLRSAGYTVEDCPSAAALLDKPRPEGPACAIVDVRMPRMSGPELFDRMTRAGSSMPFIFLTGHGDVPTSVKAMKDGAADFLLKPVDGKTLLDTVRGALARDVVERTRETEREGIRERFRQLTPREREVMNHVASGQPNKLIAADLGISEKTVKVHRHRVMEKTGAASVAELVRLVDMDGRDRSPAEEGLMEREASRVR